MSLRQQTCDLGALTMLRMDQCIAAHIQGPWMPWPISAHVAFLWANKPVPGVLGLTFPLSFNSTRASTTP